MTGFCFCEDAPLTERLPEAVADLAQSLYQGRQHHTRQAVPKAAPDDLPACPRDEK